MTHDVAVAGAGPVGLAFAIHARARGLSVLVLDKRQAPIDKACGEGVMPEGVRHLARLGITPRIGSADQSRLTGIRYTQEDGCIADGMLPAPGGLGIRRLALSQALTDAAIEAGAELHQVEVTRCERDDTGVVLNGVHAARFLVAADGLHSPLRRQLGLDGARSASRRFGLRRHYRLAPWSSLVEVHFAAGVEAYVTPAGQERVGIAFLFRASRAHASFDSLLAHFPVLASRLAHAEMDSEVRGLGPLQQRARRVTQGRAALLGDAAGYVDAITGEGITLGLAAAEALAQALPDVLAGRGTLQGYERHSRRAFRRYALTAGGVLALADRPRLRRAALHVLARVPKLFTGILRLILN